MAGVVLKSGNDSAFLDRLRSTEGLALGRLAYGPDGVFGGGRGWLCTIEMGIV
jgi:hypothetical protein